MLAHLGPCPPCLPQALSGLLVVGKPPSEYIRGLLTVPLGTPLSDWPRPFTEAQLGGLVRSQLTAVAYLEVRRKPLTVALCYQ